MENQYTILFRTAYGDGFKAGLLAGIKPMIVKPGDITINGKPVTDQTYVIQDGMCGLAWAEVSTSVSEVGRKFIKSCKEAGFAFDSRKEYEDWVNGHSGESRPESYLLRDDDHHTAYNLYVDEFNQSMGRKLEFARAFCGTLSAFGVPCLYHNWVD
jgi:hypothetical protein